MCAGFSIGTDLRKQELEKIISTERIQHRLTDLRGCVYAMDSDLFRYMLSPQIAQSQQTLLRTVTCRRFVQEVGENISDDKTSQTVGEILIFYDGYVATLKELLARQSEFTDLITEPPGQDTMPRMKELIDKQAEAIIDTRKFLDKLEHLITRAW
jgi:hypothetical protein